jgi:hypothetical protein
MNAHDLYIEATRRGLRLEPAGDFLAVRPKGKCPPDFADTLRQYKAELLDWLTRPCRPGWQAVPPDDLPLVTLEPRPAPKDQERIFGYLLGQTGDKLGMLTAWLVWRENAYYGGPGRKWDCGLICYAAARDATCWQLNRSEHDVWELLASFDEIIKRNK